MRLEDIPKLVINLPERVNRLNQFKEELKWIGSPDVHIINGVLNPDKPMLGIAQAHINAITAAKQWDKALIMEDDVVFQGKQNTLPYLNQALLNVPQDWDVLLGGLYETRGLTKVNEHWSRTGEFCALHFYIIRNFSVIENYDNHTHFDRWVNKGGKKFNVYVTNKFVATQREGFSDNVKKIVNYSDRVKRFELL
jgi:hypothetical protein